MNAQSKTVKFLDYECRLEFHEYWNGSTCICLIDKEDGAPICTATTCIPEVKLGDKEVLIKNYSENEGVLEALEQAGIVKRTGRVVHSGFVTIPVCQLTN